MTITRLDHVSVVVDDLPSAIAFFTALGMTREGEMPVEGLWVDRVNGLERVQVDIVMMRTPDGHGRLELTKFRHPRLVEIEPAIAPPNTLGLRSVMFTVESVDNTVARLRAQGLACSRACICPLTGPPRRRVWRAGASSSRWPRNSPDAFTVVGDTGGTLGAHIDTLQFETRFHTRSPASTAPPLKRGCSAGPRRRDGYGTRSRRRCRTRMNRGSVGGRPLAGRRNMIREQLRLNDGQSERDLTSP